MTKIVYSLAIGDQQSVLARCRHILKRKVFKLYHVLFTGHKSFRTEGGSWFIQSLCKNLQQYAAMENLQEIIIRTTNDVAKNLGLNANGEIVNQIPNIRYGTSRKVIWLCPEGFYFYFVLYTLPSLVVGGV